MFMQFVPVGWVHNGAFLPVIWFVNKKIVDGQVLASEKSTVQIPSTLS